MVVGGCLVVGGWLCGGLVVVGGRWWLVVVGSCWLSSWLVG